MADNKKTVRRHINTNIDFDFGSPIIKGILCALLAVMVLTVAVYQIYAHNKSQKSLPTETALSTTVYKNVTADAVAVRSETVLLQNGEGTVVPMVTNGSKVAINDTVAGIFYSDAAAQKASAYARLQNEAQYYEGIAALTSGNLVAGVDMYSNNVTNRLIELQNAVAQGKVDGFSDYVMELSESITKKQIAVGGSVDVSAKLQMIYSGMEDAYDVSGGYSEVSAPASGYYVNSVDGYEGMFDASSSSSMASAVSALTCDDIRQYLNFVPANSGSNVGKLITEFNWYFVCIADEAAADPLEVGSNVKISVDELGGKEITMKLLAKNSGEGSETALVFVSNYMDESIATLRFSQIKIRVEEYKGFAVNKKAVRTIDGEVGVFIQLGNMVRFRKINIIYSDDNVIIAENVNEDGYLRLYDEIITEGVDYNDGKIII